jgi:ArsR family transcriptional regulator
MQTNDAARILSAIGHPIRLAIFRLLVQSGPAGLSAGDIAQAVDMVPSSLSFHLKDLAKSDLVIAKPAGRFVMYAANFQVMSSLIAFLTHDCCGGNPCLPMTAPVCQPQTTHKA